MGRFCAPIVGVEKRRAVYIPKVCVTFIERDMRVCAILSGKKKRTKYVFCFILSTNLSETFLIVRRIRRDMIKYVYWS